MSISAFANLVLAIAGVVCAIRINSSALYAFAMDCLLDMVCSLVVFWRYYGSNFTIHSENRENIACLILGFFFIVSSVGIFSKGLIDVITMSYPSKVYAVFILSAIASVLCLIMAIGKFYVYKKIESQSLLLEAINTGLSAFLSILIIVAEVVYHSVKEIWFMDSLMSMVIALVLFAYGIRVILERRRNLGH